MNKKVIERILKNLLDNETYTIDKEETRILLNYIADLQRKEYNNSKAIEYINKHLYMESTCGIQHPTLDGKPNYDFDCFDLLNILEKGE